MQDSSEEELNIDKIIQYSNYKESIKNANNETELTSNASKEEYSIINLALILSNEKKLKSLISSVKNELHTNIEMDRNVLKVNINDNYTKIKEELNVPLDDKFINDEHDPSHTNKSYSKKIENVEL
jgi:precorrin-3B methylase